MNPRKASNGRARPPGAPRLPKRKKLPHLPMIWAHPENEIFFITICCQPRRQNQLCRHFVADEIFASVKIRNENEIWFAHFAALMPDHVHALISFPFERPMTQVIPDWKRFLATKLKIKWQRDFFDHRLRRHESYGEKEDYIRANPVRAGLIRAKENWPYFWQPESQT